MNPLNNNNRVPSVNPILQNIANTINFARTFQSPQAYLEALQKNNPQEYQRLMNIQKTMQNPWEVATQELSKQGINPQQLSQLLNKR